MPKMLAEIARRPAALDGGALASLPISALVEAAGEPYLVESVHVLYATTSSAGDASSDTAEPLVPRTPEIMHGLGNLIQNAIQFARHEVTVSIYWDRMSIMVEIGDDGPGFPPNLLARVGQPYLSGRGGRGGDTQHMGLGIFIAQSLLERSGAQLAFDNLPDGGAQVVIHWERDAIESAQSPRGKEAGP
jgi:two-component system, sensor histidine kinase RegB